jgi:MerR family mercuric resistance operon transcriptional regulator
VKLLTIGEVARQTGIGVETVRFYEKRGLIDDPPRTEAGYRQYPEDTAPRIRFIRHAKELGFTLTEIKGLLHLRLDAATTCDDVRLMAQKKRMDIEAKIKSLQGMTHALGKLIEACSSSGPAGHCPILDALDPEWGSDRSA